MPNRKCVCVPSVLFVLCCYVPNLPLQAKELETPSLNGSSCAADYYGVAIKNQTDLTVVEGGKFLDTSREVIRMGGPLTVCVAGLYNWTYVQKNKPSTLRLAIGGHVLETIAPSTVGPPDQEYLNFIIKIDGSDSPDWKEWASIVEAARSPGQSELLISVAVTQTKQLAQSYFYVPLISYPEHSSYLVSLFGLLLCALLYLAAKSNLLRYTVGKLPAPPNRPPFSLGLAQMAFWFYLVLAAYVYICVTMRQVHIPIGSALGLLGISATTGLAAVFVDIQKKDPAADERNKLLAE